jgi:hypothetical protein
LQKYIAISPTKATRFCNAEGRENIDFAFSLHKQRFEQRTSIGGYRER